MTSDFLFGRPNCFRDLIREWSHYLRTVANKLNNSLGDSENRLATYFYDVHYAIGPERMTNIFSLDEEYLGIRAEEEGKTPEKVTRGLIESTRIVICEGDKLKPEIMNPSVWNSGLKSYLCELKGYLECRLAKSSAKRPKVISELCRIAAFILFFLFGFFASGKHEPRILLALGCLLSAIIFAFYSSKKQRNS